MDRKEIERYLYNALQPDEYVRREAEKIITELQTKDYDFFIQNISAIFADGQSPRHLKMISGIILKNSLHSNDYKSQTMYEEKWYIINNEVREGIKSLITSCLAQEDESIYLLAGSILGFIARIELHRGDYQLFFSMMEEYAADDRWAGGVFEALGVCCEKLKLETNYVFTDVSFTIFSICIQKLENTTSPVAIKEAALKCLLTCFKAIAIVFDHGDNVLRLLQAIAVSASVDINLANKCLICLNRFVFIFYKQVSDYLNNVISYFDTFWQSTSEEVLVQVIEFWTVVAEKKEYDISRHLMNILPSILSLIRKNEDTLNKNWNAHKASAYFLEVLTGIYGSTILLDPAVYDFIDTELKSGDPVRIDLGAITLGSVIYHGCDKEVIQFSQILISNMRYQQTQESCLYALAKVCEYDFFAIIDNLTPLIAESCNIILSCQPNATNAVWIISSIFKSLNNIKCVPVRGVKISLEAQTRLQEYAEQQMKAAFSQVMQNLASAVEVARYEDSVFRLALFSALGEAVEYMDDKNIDMLNGLLSYCMQKLTEGAASMSICTINYVPVLEDVISNYICLSEIVVRKRQRDSFELIFPTYVEVLRGRPSSAMGEIYIALTNNISGFIPRIDAILPYLNRDISCLDMFILKSAINLVGCMANAMQSEFFEMSTHVIPLLIQNLSSKHVSKEIKSQVLSVFGDIALALGVNFDQYLDMSILMFEQIVGLDRKSDEEYIDTLRYNILQTFNCIVLATCESQKLREVMQKLVNGLQKLGSEENADKTFIALIGLTVDLQNLFGNYYDLHGQWFTDFCYKLRTSSNTELADAAQRALNSQ